jgi:inner membrane protein
MDPITQGVLAATFAQTRAQKKDLAKAALIGGVAGMAPDLDVLIRSSSDPLLALDFHRHFTHSLFFIPFGALLCAALMYWLVARRWTLGFAQIYLWCFLGYATHGLLDACTTYGTQLLWPLSRERFAWDLVSVIDPLFTLPLLVCVIWSAFGRRQQAVGVGVLWCVVFFGAAGIQHQRALAMAETLAHARDHETLRLDVKPSFANLAVWKVVYETDTHFYVDAVKPGLFSPRVWEGERILKYEQKRDVPWLIAGSQQAIDVARFDWFSDGFIAQNPKNTQQLIDIRYSMIPNEIAPLWGIALSPSAPAHAHVAYWTNRSRGGESASRLLDMMFE